MSVPHPPRAMSFPAYLLQANSLARVTAFTSSFLSRSCKASGRRTPSSLQFSRYAFRCIATEENAQPNNKLPLENQPPSNEEYSHSSSFQHGISASPNDDMFSTFDSYIDEIEAEMEASTKQDETPAQRRKAEQERKKAEAREAHLKRLEVLSSLPMNLVVQNSPLKCPGCGSKFQSHTPNRPGYLPENVIIELEAQRDLPDVTAEEANPLKKEGRKVTVCQRCYRLTHYGTIEPNLRVKTQRVSPKGQRKSRDLVQMATQNNSCQELAPETFRKTLERLQSIHAVIIYLVDIFDFHGSFIGSLRDIVGQKNPILLAVNKVDLLPKDFKASRVENWINQECTAFGLRGVDGIHLISSTKGTNVKGLMADALSIAKKRHADIYVIGAANVGKSSFINHLIRIRKSDEDSKSLKKSGKRPSRQNQTRGAITTSPVPGTTLDVIRLPLGGKVSLFDTPGLMMPHQLTNYLSEKELKAVLPQKNVENVTLRLGEGKAIYIGALARLEILEGRAFFFTCFFSSQVKLHPGKLENSDEFTERHAGEMLTPPFSKEGLKQLGEWTTKTFETSGSGWKKSSVDVVFSGLGWISITGPGKLKLKACVPRGVGVFTREPLMPFEVDKGVSKYTGTASVNRKQRRKTKKGEDEAWDEAWDDFA